MSKLTDDIFEWDTNRVVRWLREQGMHDCERIFYQQRINGRALLNFQEYDITSLRVSNESKSKLQKCLQRYKQQKKNRYARGDRRSFPSNNNEESSDDDHYQDAGFDTDEFDDSEEEAGEYIEPDESEVPGSGGKTTESGAVPQGLVGRRLQQLRDSMKARGGHPYVQDTPSSEPSQNGHMGNTQDYDDDDENIYDLPPEGEDDTYEVPSDSSGGAVVVRPQPTSKDKIIRCDPEEEQCEYVYMRESSDTYDQPDQLESGQAGRPGFIATRIEDEHAQYEIGLQPPTQDMYMVPQEETGVSDEMYEMPDTNPVSSIESYPPQETYEEPTIEEAKPPMRPPARAPELTEEFYEVPDEEHKKDTPPHKAPPPTPSEPEETYEVPGDEPAPAVQRFSPRGPTPKAPIARGLPQVPTTQKLNARGSAFQGFQPRSPGPRFMSPPGPGPGPGTMPPRSPRLPSSQGPGPRGMTLQGPGPRGMTPQGPGPRGMTPQGPGPRGMLPSGPGPRGMTPQGPAPRGMLPPGPGPRGMSPQGPGPRGMRPQGTGPRGMLPPGPRPKGVEPQDSPQKPAPGAWRLQGPGKGLPKNPPGDPPEDNPPRTTTPGELRPPNASLQSSPRPGMKGPPKGPVPNPSAFPGPSPMKGPKPLPGPGRGFMGRGELTPKRELPPPQSRGPATPLKPNTKPKVDEASRAYPGGGAGRPVSLPTNEKPISRIGGGPEVPQKREPEQAMNRDHGRFTHPGFRAAVAPPEVEAPPPRPGPKPSQAKPDRRPLPSPTAPAPPLPQFSTPPMPAEQKELRNRPPLVQRNEALPPTPDTRENRRASRDSTFSGSGDDPPLIPLNILKKDSSGRSKHRQSGVPLPPEPLEKTPEDKLKEAHWYHGDLDKVKAAECLKKCGQEGAFIVRNSSGKKGEFSMSLFCKGKVSHLRIPKKDGKFILGDHGTDIFDSILDLVAFHRSQPVELRSGGSTMLTVAAQVF